MGRAPRIYQKNMLVTQRLSPRITSIPAIGEGSFRVPDNTMRLTIYMVGAGASSGYRSYYKPNIIETFHITGGAGGSGGYLRLFMNRRLQNIPRYIEYNNSASISTGFRQDGGAVSVVIDGVTYIASGGLKPHQCSGADTDRTNYGGAGGAVSHQVGGIVVESVVGTTGATGLPRGGDTSRTAGSSVFDVMYGSGGGAYSTQDADSYQTYNEGDAGCLIFVCE